MLSYLFYRAAGFIVPFIPRRLGYAVLGLVAAVIYRCGASNRRMIQANVRQALGDGASPQRVDAIARRIFHNLLKNYFDLFWLPAQPTEKVARMLTRPGIEHVAEALQHGRGLIAVSAHMGNVELMTQVTAISDCKVTVVVEHIKNERVFRYIKTKRQANGVNLIPQDGALRELFRALKRNEALGLVFDRDVSGSGRVIPFFGRPARLPDGYTVLALKLGAPVLPVFIIRRPDDMYTVHVEPPIFLEGRADNDDDVRRAMLQVGAIVELYIIRYIEQWVYFHDAWPQDQAGSDQTQRRSSGHGDKGAVS